MSAPSPRSDDPTSGPQLALDTSGAAGSVAIGSAGTLLASVAIQEEREQAARLVPAIAAALREAGLSRSDLTGIVVGGGPGSFTGVRVAAATAKGLARALGLPLRAVSSLAGEALAHAEVGPVRYALFDARGDRVYGACYGVGSREVQELVAPHPGTVRDVVAGEVPAGAVFVGDGARRHRGAIEGAGFRVADGSGALTLAEGLLHYLDRHPELPPVDDPASWEPAYVRGSSAEPMWSA